MNPRPLAAALCAVALLGLSQPGRAHSGPGPVHALIRFPSLHGDTVVFEAGGAVWKIPAQGGEAVRLTADSGYDSHHLISPNGRWVAYLRDDGRDSQVMVRAAEGSGTPRARPTHIFQDVAFSPDSRWLAFSKRLANNLHALCHPWDSRRSASGQPRRLPRQQSGLLARRMEATGLHEFVRQYYGQLEKPGLILEDRWNLGGFIRRRHLRLPLPAVSSWAYHRLTHVGRSARLLRAV